MKAFIAALMATASEAVSLADSTYHPDEVTYYNDHVYREHEPIFFHRDVPVTIVEKYYHAHSDASNSSDVDSLESDLDSFYSDECPPGHYDCTDSSDYSIHSSDDSSNIESHDHDHGYYGYDYFDSEEEHYDDFHAHYRTTERYEKVPEVYFHKKLTYVRTPNKKPYKEEEAAEEETNAYGHDLDTHFFTKPDPWAGSDPYPNHGKYIGHPTNGYYAPRDLAAP